MMWTRFRSAGMIAFASMLTLATPTLHAQSPTPEGTVITNTATVSFTDANGNTYSSVSASVNVTVGFVAGIDVAGAASVTPASPSAGNTLTFTIQNIGNGTDHVQVAENISVAGVISVTQYTWNATNYASIAALNTALAGAPASITQGSTITVQIKYDVAANKGGVATNYRLTGTSVRDNAVTDNQVTTITPAQTYAVAVTPDGGQNLQKLPSNGTNYTFTFSVTNNGNGSDNFTLVGSNTGSAITVVSVNGVAGTSTSVAIAAATSMNIDVVYSVGNVAAGTTDNLKLRATSVGDVSKTDDGTADLTVIRPAITVAKGAYRDDQVTLLGPTDNVLPNEAIQYKISVTNGGASGAASVNIADNLPAELTFLSATGDAAGWTIGNAGNNVTASLTGSLAAGATRFIWIRARVK
jgi:trimeric autotransporter adhesin